MGILISTLRKIPTSLFVIALLSLISFYWMQRSVNLENELAQMSERHTAERLVAANAYNAELQRQAALNDELTRQLIDRQNQITTQLQQLESSIDGAIKNDGNIYNGIGADSLCVYRRAYGYNCK
ncbi:hypothetical protein [Gilliamella sp. CG22]|uniref:hypothetical protein n=1 Tax=Gilliamella sp. CG22 TaxID=3351504 RepID=UPI0039884C53